MQIREKIKSQSGTSLVEMMVTLMIFLMMSSAVYAVTLASDDTWQVNKTQIELQQEIRKAMDWMIYDLRQAGTSSIIDVPADDIWYTSISFKKPSGVSAGSISWNANSTQFILGGANSNELHRIEGGVTEILASNISSLQFRRQVATSNTVEVVMQAQTTASNGTLMQDNLSFDLQLRN